MFIDSDTRGPVPTPPDCEILLFTERLGCRVELLKDAATGDYLTRNILIETPEEGETIAPDDVVYEIFGLKRHVGEGNSDRAADRFLAIADRLEAVAA